MERATGDAKSISVVKQRGNRACIPGSTTLSHHFSNHRMHKSPCYLKSPCGIQGGRGGLLAMCLCVYVCASGGGMVVWAFWAKNKRKRTFFARSSWYFRSNHHAARHRCANFQSEKTQCGTYCTYIESVIRNHIWCSTADRHLPFRIRKYV